MNRRVAAILAGALAFAGCASAPPGRCPTGLQSMASELLYFGTSTPDGVVGAEAWAQFLATTVTPRFPQGLTVWSATGQWRSAGGTIGSEATQLLNVVHPDDPASEDAVREIVGAYQSLYHQETVLRVKSMVCASF